MNEIVKSLFNFLGNTEGYVTLFIIVVVLALQLKTFWTTWVAMKMYRRAFPKTPDENISIILDENYNVTELESSYKRNSIWNNILSSINAYLFNNKNNVSDFHILKDIVDRNCEAKEYEIESQISVPINYGLMGTMMGILIGTGVFTFGGGLEALLNTADSGNSGENGIKILLGGVAVAMLTSIFGIILSTISSRMMKKTIAQVENNKNLFLTWLQANLLPNLNNDAAQTIERLTQNLGHFNEAFASNTIDLKDTLSMVTSTSEDIASTFVAIQELDINSIATANIQVYERLKESTSEIERLTHYLNLIKEHQTGLADGIIKIDHYFKTAGEQIEQLQSGIKANLDGISEHSNTYFKSAIAQVDLINLDVERVLNSFIEKNKEYIDRLTNSIDLHLLDVDKAYTNVNEAIIAKGEEINTSIDHTLDKQQKLLNEHLENTLNSIKVFAEAEKEVFAQKRTELALIVDEIKNITAVKEGINVLMQESRKQTQQMASLTEAIKNLAEIKTTGKISYPKIPRYIKRTGFALTTLVAATCVYLLAPFFVDLFLLLKTLLKLN